jgi:hypothetical protein
MNANHDDTIMEGDLILALPTQPQMGAHDEGAHLLPDDLLQAIQGDQPSDAQLEQPVMDLNLQVGFVQTNNNLLADPVFEGFFYAIGIPDLS